MSCKTGFSRGVQLTACLALTAFGFLVGFFSGYQSKPSADKSVCECKVCEPQKLEITLNVKGEIPVTGAIDVNGSVSGDAQIVVHHVGELCFPPEWPMNGFQVTPIEHPAKPYIPPAGPVPSLPEPKPVKPVKRAVCK